MKRGRSCLWRFSPDDEEEKTTVSWAIRRRVHTSGTVIPAHVPTTLIYAVAATIIDGGPPHRSLPRPFLTPLAAPSPGLTAHYRATACFYGRRISMVLPKEDPWNGECWQVGPARGGVRAPVTMDRDIKTCVKLSHLWGACGGRPLVLNGAR